MTNSLVDHLCSRTKEPQSEEQLKKEHALMAPGVYREEISANDTQGCASNDSVTTSQRSFWCFFR